MRVLFTKKGCEKCEFVKENLPPNHGVEILDIGTTDGLAKLAWLSLVTSAQTNLPIYAEYEVKENTPLLEVKNILTGAINIKNFLSRNHAV